MNILELFSVSGLGDIVAIGGIVLFTARFFVSMTPTPDPQTWMGKVYRAIEVIALEVGMSKESGKEDETSK